MERIERGTIHEQIPPRMISTCSAQPHFLEKAVGPVGQAPHTRQDINLGTASTETLIALVDDALRGDSEAMRILIRGLAPVIHVRVAAAMMRRRNQARGRDPRQDLEDLVQDVFTRLFAKEGRLLRAWDPRRGSSLLNFVGLLAEREVGMIMRTMKRNPWTEEPTQAEIMMSLRGYQESPENRIDSRVILEHIAERLRHDFGPRDRTFFRLLYLDRRSAQEVARETTTSIAVIYVWRSRFRKRLRQIRAEFENITPVQCPEGFEDSSGD